MTGFTNHNIIQIYSMKIGGWIDQSYHHLNLFYEDKTLGLPNHITT